MYSSTIYVFHFLLLHGVHVDFNLMCISSAQSLGNHASLGVYNDASKATTQGAGLAS